MNRDVLACPRDEAAVEYLERHAHAARVGRDERLRRLPRWPENAHALRGERGDELAHAIWIGVVVADPRAAGNSSTAPSPSTSFAGTTGSGRGSAIS